LSKAVKFRLLEKFSSEPDKYYKVSLFDEKGFVRRRCKKCGHFFWTLDPSRDLCPNQPCSDYEFIDNPPTSLREDYVNTWKLIEDFFVKRGHTSIKRYPVVSRWRPDLYFTVASIIDFQRVEGGKIIFDLPANPLIVPQVSLRFNDIENVGVTGRHYTSFCMIGQHAYNDEKGYWKDRTIELDFRLLNEVFKIPEEEIIFVEDVWLGYGAFGYSLEYFVRGLELGNAVFTEFEGSPESYKTLRPSVVDMGAGLERFVWLQHGTPTSYDPVFGKVMDKFIDSACIERDNELLKRYYSVAGKLDLEGMADPQSEKLKIARNIGISEVDLQKKIFPIESAYIVLDHTRTLLFAIVDGALPSNVGGGYNLRVILRRALDIIDRQNWEISLEDVMTWHAESLKKMYPELIENIEVVKEIIDIERKKYKSTKARVMKLIEKLRGKPLTTEDLVNLYDSHGVTPDLLLQKGIISRIPSDFYLRVTEKHITTKIQEEKLDIDVSNIPPTIPLFYQDRYLFEFKAKVLKVINNYVILDKTAFFARSGGQEPDRGYIGSCAVLDVIKVGDVILHKIKGVPPKEGSVVYCKIDRDRRLALMRHHTATHIINGAARRVLGPWVWQHSAFKEADRARLDITHHSHLTEEQVRKIEEVANEIVMMNLPVEFYVLPRSEAEKRYGFRIYQGGVVPMKELRIVNIPNFDVEACGGTHCTTTGEVGYIKIIKTERVQDGVERIEFVAGYPAVKFSRERDKIIYRASEKLETIPERVIQVLDTVLKERDFLRKKLKKIYKQLGSLYAQNLDRVTQKVGEFKVLLLDDEALDREAHICIGDSLTNVDKKLMYVGVWQEKDKYRILIFMGYDVIKNGGNAGALIREITKQFDGSGGGNERLGQGGMKSFKKEKVMEESIKYLSSLIKLGG